MFVVKSLFYLIMMLDVYLKLQRVEPAALRDVTVCVRSGRSQEAWVQRRSATFVLEAAHVSVCLFLKHTGFIC